MAEVIPGLRPWEIMKIEQVMEKVTYGTRWYRTGLGSFTWRADFEEDWFDEFKVCIKEQNTFIHLLSLSSLCLYQRLDNGFVNFPG
jgi:hypothetical protein